MWKLEKILKTKRMGQNRQYFVKWLHWPKKFNSWVKASDTMIGLIIAICKTL
jgi:hypothetical protein